MSNDTPCESLCENCTCGSSTNHIVLEENILDRRVIDRRNKIVTDAGVVKTFERVQHTLKSVFIKLADIKEEPVIKLDLYDMVIEVRLVEMKGN